MKNSKTNPMNPKMNDAGRNRRFLDHTADIRMEVWGSSQAEMFESAVLGLVEVLIENIPESEDTEITVSVEGDGLEELFINWLREILFQHETTAFLPSSVEFTELTDSRLSAKLKGIYLNETDIRDVEVKGVTYHGLTVERDRNGYKARVIFDI
jgi:SHS2 domain-containing protein